MSNTNEFLYTAKSSPTRTLDDARRRETVIAATGIGSIVTQLSAVYNNMLGTKFKVIYGYPSGPEMTLALERGEVEGRSTSNPQVLAPTKAEIMAKYNFLIQAGPRKIPHVRRGAAVARPGAQRRRAPGLRLHLASDRAGAADRDQYGRAAGARGGAAPRLRRHARGSGFPRGRREAEPRDRRQERRGAAEDRQRPDRRRRPRCSIWSSARSSSRAPRRSRGPESRRQR